MTDRTEVPDNPFVDAETLEEALAEDEQLRTALQGSDIEDAVNRPLFQYLQSRARQEFLDSAYEFAVADISTVAEARNFQKKMLVYLNMESWWQEAVETGREAAKAVQARDFAENQTE